MRRNLKVSLIAGAAATMASLGLLPFGGGAAIASATPLSSPSCISSVAVPQSGGTIKAVGDHVHVSTGQASGHGWWDYVSGTMPPNGVTVTVTLEVYMTLPVCPGYYYSVATSKGVVYRSGGGSGNRVTARATCVSTTRKMWRSVVTVVVNTVPSSTGSVTTTPQTLSCTPS